MNKKRTAYYLLLPIALVVAAVLCVPLVFGMDWVDGRRGAGAGEGGAVARDPFVKTAAGATVAIAANQTADKENAGAGEAANAEDAALAEIAEPVALVEYIQTDLEAANRLLGEFGATEDVTPLRAKLGEMIDAGEAELIETCFLRSSAGTRAKTESVREHIYPTEFDPPEIPQQFEGKSTPPPRTSANPTAFDTRMVGSTVEVEMNISRPQPGGRDIALNIAPEIVKYLGERALVPGATEEHRVELQPEFAAMRLITQVTALEGTTSLLGLLRPTPADGKRVFVLVSVDILKPGLPEEWNETGEDVSITKKIVTHLEWIELDHADANRLLRKGWSKRDAGDLRAELAEMMTAGEAELVESSYVKSTHGTRSVVASVREHIYPTEWDPAEIPEKVKMDDVTIRPTGANPTALDVRNVGTTVEVDANIGTEKIVTLNIAPEIVSYLGDRKIDAEVPLEVRGIVQPDFYSMKLSANVQAFPGQHNLLGCFTPSRDASKRVLLLFKLDVVR